MASQWNNGAEEITGNDDDEVYCICRQPYQEQQFMIECDKCTDWFHGSCVGIQEYQAQDIDIYHCPKCQKIHGPLVLKRRRNIQRHNYKELNDGIKPIYAGTLEFIRQLKAKKFTTNVNEGLIVADHGSSVTVDFLEQNQFRKPVLVKNKAGLGLTVPANNFTVFDVEQHIGPMHEIHVIDVAKQEDLRMKMREWTEYYNCPLRTKVLNVISLEFSQTSLSNLVFSPTVVRDITWVENIWPKEMPEDSPHTMPRVQKYCLMGVKDCYTDFHVDFGGTSVWYHVLRGEKVFYLIEPTDENLRQYEIWVSSSDQNQVFFGDRVKECYKCILKQGQTLLIPTGWIHAVLTPVDTLVFGGNFLHSFNIGLQLKIYELEKKLSTPIKFLFPNYETIIWYAARAILRKIKDLHMEGFRMPQFLRQGVLDLIKFLKQWTSKKDEFVKFHKYQVPIELNHTKLIKALEKELKNDEKVSPNTSKLRISAASMLDQSKPKTAKSGKTVIKLKIPAPIPTIKEVKEQNRKGNKKKKTKVKTPVKEQESPPPKTKKKVKKKKESKESKKKESKKEIKQGLKVKVSNGKIMSNSGEAVISKKHFQPLIESPDMKKKQDDPLKLRLSFNSNLNLTGFKDKDLEAAEFLAGMEVRNMSTSGQFDYSTSSFETSLDRGDHPVASTAKKTTNNIMADIEAAKRDLFLEGGDRKGIFFTQKEDDLGRTILKNEPEDNDSDDGYKILEPLPKPKGNRKRSKSESDSDYDPLEDSLYQDARFVYPRLSLSSALDEDDFSWNPGQRSRKKTKREKTLSPRSKLNSNLNSSLMLSEDKTEIANVPWQNATPIMPPLKPIALVLPTNKTTDAPPVAVSNVKHSLPGQTSPPGPSIDKKKEKPRKGQATAKQRLGKLLKLDKMGSRYMR